MKLLIALVVSLCVILLAENSIRKHASIWYFSALVLSFLSLFIPESAPDWISSFVAGYISRGTLATALFVLVMYARVLPPKSRLFRTLMSLRAPLAIMAAFMILIHNGSYFIHYLNMFHRKRYMTMPEIFAAICTTVMLLLLIPLTVTSFTSVRKKMKGLAWKKLQRLSYIFYALIYIHVSCLFGLQISRGNTSYNLDLAIYTAIFGTYLVSRVALYLKNSKKINASKRFRFAGIPIISALAVFIILFRIPEKNDNIKISAEPVALSESEISTSTDVEAVTADGETMNTETVNTETINIETTNTDVSEPIYQDGKWTGTAFGYNDDITVSVTIEAGSITDISVLETSDDDEYFGMANKEVPASIISAQSTDVDTVSGATFSSEGIINAVEDALSKAMISQQ